MAQPTDVEALAKEFLDLWQQQAAATLTDPALGDAMARWLELAGGFFAAAQGIKPPAPAGAAGDGKARAASPGAAPGGGQHGLDDLLRRLAACEKRLARLEKQPKGGRRRASPRARRRSG
jgi:hypothetical protein